MIKDCLFPMHRIAFPFVCLLALGLFIAIGFPGQRAMAHSGLPSSTAPRHIILVDTHSGANWQELYHERIYPELRSQKGIDVLAEFTGFDEIDQHLGPDGPRGVDILVVHPTNAAALIARWPEAFLDLRTVADRMPNLTKVIPEFYETILGAPNGGKAVPQWINYYGFLHDTDHVSDPPRSFRELHRRAMAGAFRDDGQGRFGMIAPNVKSAGGRKFLWSMLHAFGCSFEFTARPDDADPAGWVEDASWEPGWQALRDMLEAGAMQTPLATSGSSLFNQFHTGKTWAAIYAGDYFLWSRRQGRVPASCAASNLAEGLPISSSYWLVPRNAPHLTSALSYVNYMLSTDFQKIQFTELFLLPSVLGEIHDLLPPEIYGALTPTWAELEDSAVILGPPAAMRYIEAVAAEKLGL